MKNSIRELIEDIPYLGNFIISGYRRIRNQPQFINSRNYWEERYKRGGNSGEGSYNELAEFKSKIINNFVEKHKIKSVIEFGCGDGNQVKYFNFNNYLGYDVSPTAINLCLQRHDGDPDKTFKILKNYEGETADLTLSLDVIYHLVERESFYSYMEKLFSASNKYVIIYSSNKNQLEKTAHVRHWKFTSWIKQNRPDFNLIEYIPNKYPIENENTSISTFSDFYIFQIKK